MLLKGKFAVLCHTRRGARRQKIKFSFKVLGLGEIKYRVFIVLIFQTRLRVYLTSLAGSKKKLSSCFVVL